jgi:hypothetical protein
VTRRGSLTDLRYAERSLRRTPLLSGTAVLSLGLGIGGLTTMGSAVDALLLRPFPYDLEGRLVYVGTEVKGRGGACGFRELDDERSSHVAVVSAAFARSAGRRWGLCSGASAACLPCRD